MTTKDIEDTEDNKPVPWKVSEPLGKQLGHLKSLVFFLILHHVGSFENTARYIHAVFSTLNLRVCLLIPLPYSVLAGLDSWTGVTSSDTADQETS